MSTYLPFSLSSPPCDAKTTGICWILCAKVQNFSPAVPITAIFVPKAAHVPFVLSVVTVRSLPQTFPGLSCYSFESLFSVSDNPTRPLVGAQSCSWPGVFPIDDRDQILSPPFQLSSYISFATRGSSLLVPVAAAGQLVKQIVLITRFSQFKEMRPPKGAFHSVFLKFLLPASCFARAIGSSPLLL